MPLILISCDISPQENIFVKPYFIFSLILILFFTNKTTLSQSISAYPYIGVVANIGSTINRVGINLGLNSKIKNTCLNTRIAVSYNFKHWASRHKTFEVQLGMALIYAFGNTWNHNYYFNLLSNLSNKKYSIGYCFNAYFDKTNTSQRTGTIGIQIKEFHFFTENDILGERGVDKFRTAAIQLGYRKENTEYSCKMILWTGNYKAKNAIKVSNDSIYPARFGYYDLSATHCGKYSHGIICFQIQKAVDYSQAIKIMAGIDSEKIRHIIQNKIIHDAPFIPEKLIKYPNLHYPMIDETGSPYLYRKDQNIKPIELFYNFSINDNIFY